jgi:hypothetical protein
MNSWDKYDLDDFAKIYFENLLGVDEDKIKELFKKSYEDLELKISEFEKTINLSKINGWKDMEYIWNVGGFILTTSLDLKISGEGLSFSNDYGKKEYYIKNSCVLIYEFLEDIEQLLGKEFYEILERFKISQELVNELREKKKTLSNIKKEHNKSLKDIRTIIGAHRDHKFLLQMETMKNLRDIAFLKLISIFDQALNDLGIPMQRILNESVNNFVSMNKK